MGRVGLATRRCNLTNDDMRFTNLISLFDDDIEEQTRPTSCTPTTMSSSITKTTPIRFEVLGAGKIHHSGHGLQNSTISTTE